MTRFFSLSVFVAIVAITAWGCTADTAPAPSANTTASSDHDGHDHGGHEHDGHDHDGHDHGEGREIGSVTIAGTTMLSAVAVESRSGAPA